MLKAAHLSRRWSIRSIFNSDMYLQNQNQIITAIDDGQVKAGLIIPPNFATNTDRGTASVLMILDGSDSASVTSGFSGASLVAQNYSLGLISEQVVRKTGLQTGGAAQAPAVCRLLPRPACCITRI